MNTILSAGIMVGLNGPRSGPENVSTIEVCAAIIGLADDCSVDLDFELNLRTVNDSAGNIKVH